MSGPVKVILRCVPVITKDDLMDVENVRHHEMFQTGSLTPVRRGVDANGKDIYLDVPICVNHEPSNVVGVVTHLREDSDHTGGHWLFAHARIDKPPGWLNRDTAVSISYKCVNRGSGMGGDWSRVYCGWLTEISLLAPSREPAHPRARVVWLEPVERPSASPAAATTSDRGSPAASTYSAAVITRTKRNLDEREELNRRLEWLERTGRSPDFELVLKNLQDELHGRSLEREYARAVMASRVPIGARAA